jgi:hypothetical protein
MRLAVGVALLLLGLLAWLAGAHVRGLRYFDRPGVARNPLFDPILSLIKWALLLGGLLLIGDSSRRAGTFTALLLVLLWSYRRFVRSLGFQGWLLRRDFEALRRERPAAPDAELLYALAMRRHPAWGPELIEQMVEDYPTIEGLARKIAQMERGFRGFRP